MNAYNLRALEVKGTKQILMALVIAVAVMIPSWTLTAASPAPVDLGSCDGFAIVAGTTITTTGGGMVNGDVGLSPAGSQGIPPAQVNGNIYNGGAIAAQAQVDLTAAYNDAAGRSLNRITKSGNIGGQTLAPGLYWSATSLQITGNLTLDAGGNPSSVWIFQMGSTLTTAAGGAGDPHSRVILAGGARASNVFWQVGSSATLGTYSIFKGTILAQASISMDTDSIMEGRALARTGAVTFNGISSSLPQESDVPPVALAIRPGYPAYAGQVGANITLNGSASYDPNGDTITNYTWDVNGNGVYGDAGDISSATWTAVVSFPTQYVGVIGLKVAANGLTGTNITTIYVSSNDIAVVSFAVTNIVPDVSAAMRAVFMTDPTSAQGFNNVVVRFYNGNPLLHGTQIGGNYLVNLPRGVAVPLNVTIGGLAGVKGKDIYIYVDANRAIPEANELNNVAASQFAGVTPINDFDGDGKTDLSVYWPVGGQWYVLLSGNQRMWNLNWGWDHLLPVTGDYDGDGKYDAGLYAGSNGWWFVHTQDGRNPAWYTPWGWKGAVTVWGDYDGDAKADLAIFDDINGRWYIHTLDGRNLAWALSWGWNGALPVPGDYDGDGRNDLAVYDRHSGKWYIHALPGRNPAWGVAWGWDGAVPVPGDYDGDGKWDLAVFDDINGRWYIHTLDGRNLAWNLPWGWAGAVPVPGDYDGDGIYDLAVYNQATGLWYVYSLAKRDAIVWGQPWGWSEAIPVGCNTTGK